MNTRTALTLMALILAGTAGAEHRKDELVIRFRNGTNPADEKRFLNENGASVEGEVPGLRIKKVRLPPGLSVEKAMEKFRKHPDIELAEPNIVVHKASLPNDPLFNCKGVPSDCTAPPGYQWGLQKIGAMQSWTLDAPGAKGDASIIIAILDTGIRSTHPDITAKLVPGTNIVDPLKTPEDDEYHGTYVAGIAAADTDNGIGIAGTAWNARVMPVKVLNSAGDGNEFDVIAGMNWALDHGARVINMSIGSCKSDGTCSGGSQYGAEAMENAWRRGAVLVAATGNEGINGASYPAAYPYVLGVGATTNSDHRSSFSNFGAMVDLVAPGGDSATGFDTVRDIFSIAIGPSPAFTWTYATAYGTSASAPFVSGLAAILLAQNPVRTNEEVVRIMENTADQVDGAGWNPGTGYGRINMYRALTGDTNQAPGTGKITAYNFPNPFAPPLHRFTTFVVKGLNGKSLSVEIRDGVGNLLWSKKYTEAEASGKDFYFNSELRWDGRDKDGRPVPNGVYFAAVKSGSARTTVKVVVMQ